MILFIIVVHFNILYAQKISINRVDNYLFPKIRVYLDILDLQGNIVKGIISENLKIVEDGKEIDKFNISVVYAGGKWIDIILGIDRSGSMKGSLIIKAKKAAIEFINCLRSCDNISLLVFDDKIEFLTEFTKNRNLLFEKINSIELGRDTSLYDALLASIEKIKDSEAARRAIIFFTDGKDTTSKNDLNKVIELIKENNIPIITIGFNNDINKKILKEISTSSGKKLFLNPVLEDLREIYRSIANHLGIQYFIEYQSQASRTKAMHEIKIIYRKNNTEIQDKRYFYIY